MKKNLLTLLTCAVLLTAVVSSCKKSTTDPVTPVTPVDTTKVKPVVVPTFTSVSPAKALPNSTVSLIGTNFTTDVTKITVTFNGVNATVYSATATEIVAGVPATAKTGKIVVISNGTTLTSAADFTVTSGTQTTYANGYFEHIAIDASGNIYGDGSSIGASYLSVNKATPAGVVSVLAGGVAAATNPFKQLWGTAVDASGNVYVVDQGKYQIDKITPAGVVTVLAGSGTKAYTDGAGTAAQFNAPIGLAIDAAGNLYTNDTYRVRKITPAGVVTTYAGAATSGYVDGAAGTGLLGASEGIAVDAAGNVYTDDNKSVRKISPNGTITTLAGSGTTAFTDAAGKAAAFFAPQAMAVDAAGNVFVADNQYNSTAVVFAIRMVSKAGLVTTFMKNTYTQATAPATIVNGAIGTATTNFPDGITFDAAGNMYIANTGAGVGSVYGIVSKISFQ